MARYCGTVVGCDSGFRGSDEHPCWPSQIFLGTPNRRAKQTPLFRTNRAPLPRKGFPSWYAPMQGPTGTKHISPQWQLWGKVSSLQKAPGRGDTSSPGPMRTCKPYGVALASSKMEVLWNVHLRKKGEGGIPMQKQIPRASALVMTAFRGERLSGVSGGRSLRVARMPG